MLGNPVDPFNNLNMGLTLDGNRLLFEDKTACTAGFRIYPLGQSGAATYLGIYQNAASGRTITGGDKAKVRTESVFTHLINL